MPAHRDQKPRSPGVKRDGEEVPGDQQKASKRRRETPEELETDVVMQLKNISVDMAEMYSPPRVTKKGQEMGLKTGGAMGLTTGWDFRRQADRDRAWEYIGKHRPQLIIGSPMCQMFSQLQTLSGWTEEKSRRWCEAREHIKFMIAVYRHQLRQGRWFLHEHPHGASSWSLEEVRKLMQEEGVHVWS